GEATNIGSMSIVGTALRYLSGTLHNAGTIVHSDDGRIGFINGVLNNRAGAVYDFAGDGDFRWYGGAVGQFNNHGLFRKSAGSDVTSMTGSGSGIAFNNDRDGRIVVEAGVLTLNGSGTSTGGTFTVAAGAVLSVTGGSDSNAWSGT